MFVWLYQCTRRPLLRLRVTASLEAVFAANALCKNYINSMYSGKSEQLVVATASRNDTGNCWWMRQKKKKNTLLQQENKQKTKGKKK